MQVMFWGINLKEISDAMGDNFGMMLAPVFYPENPYADALFVVYPNNYVIPTWSKYPQESADMLMSLYSNESMMRYHEVTGAIPIIKDFDPAMIEDKWAKWRGIGCRRWSMAPRSTWWYCCRSCISISPRCRSRCSMGT